MQGVKGQKCHSLLGVEADKAESCGNLTFGLLVAKKKKKKNSMQAPYVKNYGKFYLFINVFLCFMIQKKLIKTT